MSGDELNFIAMAKAFGKLRRRSSDVCRGRRGSDRANQNVRYSADSSNASAELARKFVLAIGGRF